jgi:hypothetical protein
MSYFQSDDPRRALADLFPHYLRTRFRGWSGRTQLFAELGLLPPEFLLPRSIVEETPTMSLAASHG